jgi:hypothetical protein
MNSYWKHSLGVIALKKFSVFRFIRDLFLIASDEILQLFEQPATMDLNGTKKIINEKRMLFLLK